MAITVKAVNDSTVPKVAIEVATSVIQTGTPWQAINNLLSV